MPRRYLLVRIMSERTVTEEQFSTALMSAVRRSFGEIGFARIDPKLVRYESDRLLAIVACKPGMVTELEAAVSLISSDGETPIATLVLQVSGTVKGLRVRRSKRHR
jgi:RNase P/RNase MRP subunit POP5